MRNQQDQIYTFKSLTNKEKITLYWDAIGFFEEIIRKDYTMTHDHIKGRFIELNKKMLFFAPDLVYKEFSNFPRVVFQSSKSGQGRYFVNFIIPIRKDTLSSKWSLRISETDFIETSLNIMKNSVYK